MAATSQIREKFEDYEGFVEKFKPKRTTDGCMTPPEIYAVALGYVQARWGVRAGDVVRPFWPGGDYEAFSYPEGCCVVDNPPFSILSEIQAFYIGRGIRFFLFVPALTCLSSRSCMQMDHIVCDANITYENGAVVRTGFVTNLEPRFVLEADHELGRALNAADAERRRSQGRAKLPSYEYPDAVITSAQAQYMAAHGVSFRVRREDCLQISALDEQKACGKGIFGAGLLLSERAAAERAAAERAAAERAAARRWELSPRERELQAKLGRR